MCPLFARINVQRDIRAWLSSRFLRRRALLAHSKCKLMLDWILMHSQIDFFSVCQARKETKHDVYLDTIADQS